jgi:hypothetical protein
MGVTVILPDFIEFKASKIRNAVFTDGKHGVYVFYGDNNEALYVGKSKNVYRRLKEHMHHDSKSRLRKEAVKIRVYLENNPFHVDIYETFLINELKPRYNYDKSYHDDFQTETAERCSEVELLIRDLTEERDEILVEIDEGVCTVLELRGVERKIAKYKRELATLKRRLA